MKPSHTPKSLPQGLFYERGFVSTVERRAIFEYLETLYPIWEQRYSKHNPPPPDDNQRWLLRPVYWKLNTCLINYYGKKFIDGKWVDCARVGEHRDFEPGPVASISFGERALFQFVKTQGRRSQAVVSLQQWLEDRSLQLFAGKIYKDTLFHRVQRVDTATDLVFPTNVDHYETRRINFTFRYVPESHWVDFKNLPAGLKEDVTPYVQALGKHSPFFSSLLK